MRLFYHGGVFNIILVSLGIDPILLYTVVLYLIDRYVCFAYAYIGSSMEGLTGTEVDMIYPDEDVKISQPAIVFAISCLNR